MCSRCCRIKRGWRCQCFIFCGRGYTKYILTTTATAAVVKAMMVKVVLLLYQVLFWDGRWWCRQTSCFHHGWWWWCLRRRSSSSCRRYLVIRCREHGRNTIIFIRPMGTAQLVIQCNHLPTGSFNKPTACNMRFEKRPKTKRTCLLLLKVISNVMMR